MKNHQKGLWGNGTEEKLTMADDSLCFLTLHELSERIRNREVSPVEVVNAHLERCERLNSTLNAFITLAPGQAIKEAEKAERDISAGNYRGPLHGIPVGIKDLFDTENIRTTYGSSFYKHHVPENDAASVKLLKRAGAIILGKCNTHEFAAGSTTNNPWYGASRNPWDLKRSPGGSSGGSGAAVAAFLCPGATGTDTGGSIRNPAACNGVVGLKPTYGRVSLLGRVMVRTCKNNSATAVASPRMNMCRRATIARPCGAPLTTYLKVLML